MALVLRETKGSALEWTELDGNFTHLSGLIDSKQDIDPTITALAGVTTTANSLIYATAPDVFAATPLTAFARSLLDDADAASARTTLGAIAAAEKGAANGLAPLGGDGKITSAYLPSYVDDVLEYASTAAFPTTGETGKIYIALNTNKTYRWSGSTYVEISASPGSTDAVTEGATNLYFTQARVRAATLLGLNTGAATAITASDTVLSAFGKLQGLLNTLGTMSTQAANNVNITGGSISVASLDISGVATVGPFAYGSVGGARFGVRPVADNTGPSYAIAPTGTANLSQVECWSGSDTNNAAYVLMRAEGAHMSVFASATGAGSPPATFSWGVHPNLARMDAAGAAAFPAKITAKGVAWQAGGGFGQGAISSDGNWGGYIRGLPGAQADLALVDSDGVAVVMIKNGAIVVPTPESWVNDNRPATTAWVRTLHASDSRIKSDLMPVGGTLEKLSDITAYTYKQHGYEARKMGSIAQDWQKHWSEATPEITYDGEQRLSIDPLAAIAILTQALNELHDKVKRLEATQ